MAAASPFLSAKSTRDSKELCLICCQIIRKKEKSQGLGEKGKESLKTQAEAWSKIDIPLNNDKHHFTEVLLRLSDGNCVDRRVHTSCRADFRNKIERFQETFGLKSADAEGEQDDNGENTVQGSNRSTRSVIKPLRYNICFICNSKRSSDTNPYKEGGLARCSSDVTASQLITRKDYYLQDPSHRFYEASTRLNLYLSGQAHDVFAADVFYHQSCYVKYTHSPITPRQKDDAKDAKKADIMQEFLYTVKRRMIRDKEAFLLNELLTDVNILSQENSLDESAVKDTKSLKRHLLKEFGEELSYFPSGKYVIVHSSDINPCEYSLATLKGCGLRDHDLVKSFACMIRRKMKSRMESKISWPLSPEEMIAMLDEGPLPEIYNAIYHTLYDGGNTNSFGYNVTQSHIKATKIWSLASDWEALIRRTPSPKQAVMGLVIHRITGSKETVDMLHKCNHVISYEDIRMQNIAWSRMVSTNSLPVSSLRKRVPTHFTMDNNDGRQETFTGSGTTHDTNATLFQTPNAVEEMFSSVGQEEQQPLNICDDFSYEESVTVPHFNIGARAGPSLFPQHFENESRHLLDDCLLRDIAWSAASFLTSENEDLPLLGSWTPFNKAVSSANVRKCVQEFLPVIPQPPEYSVCKYYMDLMLELISELEIPHIFVHSDELVYSKLCQILWKNKELYQNIILLMGGFHQLRVMQRLLFKRFSCKEFHKWWVDAGIIAAGSADQAFEGRHYYRSMRLHKECFDALVQYRIEKITGNALNVENELRNGLLLLRKSPNADSLEAVVRSEEFKKLAFTVMDAKEGSDGDLTTRYLKDVSCMLAMVSAVREGNIDRHLQAEKEMLKQAFAFNHQNYARYCSFQHVYLRNLKIQNNVAYTELTERGYGASITGENFSSIHGDLVTELFNKECKGTAGPFRAGFSTNTTSVNTWVRTIHVHSLLRTTMRKQLHVKTSSKHKEVTNAGKKKHENHVKKLKEKLKEYGIDPFGEGKPRSIVTGQELDDDVSRDMIRASDVGKSLYCSFVEERLVKGTKGFFAPIKRVFLKTGIVKQKKTKKSSEILKEDCQAFGLIISKCSSLEEAFDYPITTVPLAIATTDSMLRQGEKASFRNFLISQSSGVFSDTPKGAVWLVDGMAAIRSLKPKKTYRDWIECLLKFMQPPIDSMAVMLGMVNDNYLERSVKSCLRKKRGSPGAQVHVTGVEQRMLEGGKWQEFLHNGANKQELIELVASYVTQEGKHHLKLPFIITSAERTFQITDNKVEELFSCNQEEADTRLILHALLANNDVVIVAKDTDVLILMVWAFQSMNVKYNWFLNFDKEKYVNIKSICEYLGKDLALALPALHCLTGCDSTSYFYKAGKVRVLQKVLKKREDVQLLKKLGCERNIKENDVEDVKEFIRKNIYSGKADEAYLSTRIRLYKEMKTKSSSGIPPDPKSVEQAIKRCHYQAFQWYHCHLQQVPQIFFEENGWQWDPAEKIVSPVWFIGSQLPPSFSTKRKNYQKTSKKASSDAGDESSDAIAPKAKKRRRKISSILADMKEVSEDGDASVYDGDDESAFSNAETVTFSEGDESEWEVSDFLSSEDSCDEWLP